MSRSELDRRVDALWVPAARRGFRVDVRAVMAARRANPGDWMWKQLMDNLKRGRVHPVFTASGTVTGRMTVTRPNLQGMSPAYRRALLAEEGMALVGCDLAHIEPTLAAALSGDQALIAAVQPGRDPYSELAELLGRDRKTAKVSFLAPLYGEAAPTLAENLGIGVDEARSVLRGIDLTYPRLAQWVREVKAASEAGEPIAQIDGSPAADAGLIDGKRASYRAVNYLLQGSAAILFKTLTLRVDSELREVGMPNAAWLPIHDELVVQVPETRAEEARDILAERMSCTVRGVPVFGDADLHGDRFGK